MTTSCGDNGTKSRRPTARRRHGQRGLLLPGWPATTNVTATVTDSDGAVDTDDQFVEVTVNNVAPVVTLTGDTPVNEGSTHTYGYSTVDPGSEVFTLDAQTCDGGTLSTTASTRAPAREASTAPSPTTAPTTSVSPSVTASRPIQTPSKSPSTTCADDRHQRRASVNEGSTYSLTLGAVTDPGTDTVTSYIVHWGDGSSDTYTPPAPRPTPTPTARYLRHHRRPGRRRRHPPRPANALSVTVNNVAPTIAISGAANVNEGSSYSLTLGAVTDPGTDTVTSYIVHWGDGNSEHLRHRRRQDPHLRRRPQHLRDHR